MVTCHCHYKQNPFFFNFADKLKEDVHKLKEKIHDDIEVDIDRMVAFEIKIIYMTENLKIFFKKS